MIPVTLKVEPLEEKSFTVRTSDISLIGESSVYSYGVEAGNVEVTVRGLAEDVEGLTVSSMRPTADVGGIASGTHQIKVVLTLPENCVQTGNTDVTVHIRAASESAEESVPEESSTEAPSEAETAEGQT